jgi:hypothetical protein
MQTGRVFIERWVHESLGNLIHNLMFWKSSSLHVHINHWTHERFKVHLIDVFVLIEHFNIIQNMLKFEQHQDLNKEEA